MKKTIVFLSIFTALLIFMAVSINELNSYLYSIIAIAAMWCIFLDNIIMESLKLKLIELTNERNSLSAQNDTIKEMYETALLDLCQANSESELLRQKYSRTSQPRSSGKFVKKTKQVSVLSLKQICENNLGVARPSEMYNGEISKVCGYSLDYDCLIFGLDSYAGFTTFPDTSVIFNEYKSYEYGRL